MQDESAPLPEEEVDRVLESPEFEFFDLVEVVRCLLRVDAADLSGLGVDAVVDELVFEVVGEDVAENVLHEGGVVEG